MSHSRTLDALAEEVQREARALTTYLTSNSYYTPSFSPPWKEYPELPDHIQQSRRRLQEATKAVYALAAGPSEYMRELVSNYDTSALRWLVHFKVPEAIPLHGSIPYSQVAEVCDVDEGYLRRILRYCMTNELFDEPEPDHVAHSTFSACLVTDPGTRAYVEHLSEDIFPAAAKLVEANEKWAFSGEGTETGFQLAHNTSLAVSDFFAQPGNEHHGKRYDTVLKDWHALPSHALKYTVEGHDWRGDRIVVDIGGGTGVTAIALARAYPHLRIIVQDLPEIVAEGEKNLPAELKNRIRFLAHDFFDPQPEVVLRADTYLIRLVLHEYSNKQAARIIKNLLPGLRRDAGLVVVDAVIPPPKMLSAAAEKKMRARDFLLLTVFNGMEREIEDWKKLLAIVSPELVIEDVKTPKGSALSIIEIGLVP